MQLKQLTAINSQD